MGRFITRDSFQGFEDEPLTLNQYAYTNNNPVMSIDPSGHGTILLVLSRDFLRDAVKYSFWFAATVAVGYLVIQYSALGAFRKVMVSALATWLTNMFAGVISRNITSNYVWYKTAWYLPDRYFSYGG